LAVFVEHNNTQERRNLNVESAVRDADRFSSNTRHDAQRRVLTHDRADNGSWVRVNKSG